MNLDEIEDEHEDTSEGDVEDAIDRMAERFPDGDDPMFHHILETKCRRCEIEFEVRAGKVAWCPECHIHKDPRRPPAEILEDVDIQVDNNYVILTGRVHIHFHERERPMLFMHVFRLGEKAAAKKVVQLFSEPKAKPQRLKLYFEQELISDVEAITPDTDGETDEIERANTDE